MVVLPTSESRSIKVESMFILCITVHMVTPPKISEKKISKSTIYSSTLRKVLIDILLQDCTCQI